MARKDAAFQFDDAIFKKKIRDLARRNGINEPKFVREQGSFLGRDFARMSPPYAKFPGASKSSGAGYVGTAKDKKQGEFAVLADLRKIFRQKNKGLIDFCIKRFGAGFTNQPMRSKGGNEYRISYNRICISIGEMSHWHSSQQNLNGRVSGNRSSSETAWCSESLFKKYYNAEKKKVGIAKASIIRAALALNPSIKAPAWVTRHLGVASGSGRLKKQKNNPAAYLNASAAGLQHVTRPAIIRRVMNGRIKAMEKRLEFIVKGNAKKSGFKVRG